MSNVVELPTGVLISPKVDRLIDKAEEGGITISLVSLDSGQLKLIFDFDHKPPPQESIAAASELKRIFDTDDGLQNKIIEYLIFVAPLYKTA